MNKRHYPWWGHVKAIIRGYPGQMEGGIDGERIP